MAGRKFLTRDSSTGKTTEVAGLQATAGAGSAGEIVALDAAGLIPVAMMPSGIGAEQVTVTWAENVSANDLINVYLDTATWKGRKADGGTNKYPAHAFAVASGTAAGTGLVQYEGLIAGATSVLTGKLYLSTTAPGGWQQTIPAGPGLHQVVGLANSGTSWYFQPQEEIVILA